jgi:signal transduction histidine kinase
MMKLRIIEEGLDDRLIDYLKKNKKVVHASELPKDVISSIIEPGSVIIVPCSIKGRLIAVLFVGRKLSEDPYREEEVDVFSVLAPQLATVIERIQPYEKVKEDYIVVQQAAERAQQMATLGELALQAGHEIKNPIAAIDIHTELLSAHVGDKEYLEKYIDLVKRNSKKIADIVDKMKQFGTARTEEMQETDLNGLIRDRALFLMEGHIKKKEIKVELDLRDIPKIQADASSLEKAFVNIMLNAVEAMDNGGMLCIKTALAGKNVEVRISDTGHGISKENLKKIFLPMFTTRHEGTGLGLSITYKTIVADHGGNIEVKSEEGKGSEFIVSIPVYQVPHAV